MKFWCPVRMWNEISGRKKTLLEYQDTYREGGRGGFINIRGLWRSFSKLKKYIFITYLVIVTLKEKMLINEQKQRRKQKQKQKQKQGRKHWHAWITVWASGRLPITSSPNSICRKNINILYRGEDSDQVSMMMYRRTRPKKCDKSALVSSSTTIIASDSSSLSSQPYETRSWKKSPNITQFQTPSCRKSPPTRNTMSQRRPIILTIKHLLFSCSFSSLCLPHQ